MLGWSMTIPAAGGWATWGAVGETGQRVLAPLAWALSLPLTWGEFDESRALVITDGIADVKPSETLRLPTRSDNIVDERRNDGGESKIDDGANGRTENSTWDRPIATDLHGAEDQRFGGKRPVFNWHWRGGARFFARSWDGPMTLEIDTVRFPVDPLPMKWLKFLFFAGLCPLRRSGLAVIHHGALIERDGCGVLIAGPSGMGKSTLCHDIGPDWNVLADDMVLCYRSGDRLCARPLPTWSRWTLPDKTPQAAESSHEVTLRLAVMLGRGEAAWRPLSPREIKIALSTSFSYFIPHWRLDPELRFFHHELVDGMIPVLDDFQRNLPGDYFCRNLSDAPAPYFDAMIKDVVKI